MRYRFYREHKYVSAALNKVERLIAKTDFCDASAVAAVAAAFQELKELLQGHALYEDERLHALLKERHSTIHEHAEAEHAEQDAKLLAIQQRIDDVAAASDDGAKQAAGYALYLAYRKFVADSLQHLHEEETVLLPELQRLYSDEELRQVEAQTYAALSAEEIVAMMRLLFPHMNPDDRYAIMSDAYSLQPTKFLAAWPALAPLLRQGERAQMALLLQRPTAP